MEDKELNRIFSKNLTYWLHEREKTQADLYKKMKVSSAVASDWCNEKKMPRIDKMVIIASWLSIELSDLLEDKPHRNPYFRLNDLEKEVIIKFRQVDSGRRESILVLLGIEQKRETVAGTA